MAAESGSIDQRAQSGASSSFEILVLTSNIQEILVSTSNLLWSVLGFGLRYPSESCWSLKTVTIDHETLNPKQVAAESASIDQRAQSGDAALSLSIYIYICICILLFGHVILD